MDEDIDRAIYITNHKHNHFDNYHKLKIFYYSPVKV